MATDRTILITGASGFIGRAVLRELAARGIAAHAMLRKQPAQALPAGITPLMHDMANGAPEPRFSHCLHLAWGGLPDYKSPSHLEQELPLQRAFLESLLARGTQKLVVTGTCLEYGMQEGELDESAPLRPTLPYAQAKAALFHWLEQQPIDATWARLFYCYGEEQKAPSLYAQLRAAVARGDARLPMSGGEQMRDYLPVERVAAHLVDLLLGEGNGAVNVCSGAPVRIRELVAGWIAEHGWTIDMELGAYPYPDYEPMAFWGNDATLQQCITQVAHG